MTTERIITVVAIAERPYFMDLTGVDTEDQFMKQSAMGIPARIQHGVVDDGEMTFSDPENQTIIIAAKDLAFCILLANEHPTFAPILQAEILRILKNATDKG